MIKNIGITASEKDISFEIPEESKERVHSFFKINSIQKADNIVVFNISNNRPDTMWPVERFRETAEIISNEYDAVFIITSIPADKDRAVTLSKEIKKAFYFDEVAKVMDFAALVSVAGVLICGEGGAMHIGASVNTPTISLWGGTASVANWMHREKNQFMIKKDMHVNTISAEDILDVIRNNELLKETL
jgi:ADP-heptose:LPS heptosyltransferase